MKEENAAKGNKREEIVESTREKEKNVKRGRARLTQEQDGEEKRRRRCRTHRQTDVQVVHKNGCQSLTHRISPGCVVIKNLLAIKM